MIKQVKRFIVVFCLILAFSASVSVFAETTMQVVIYTTEYQQESNILNCSNYIDFDGVNSIYSTNNLYVELYEKGSLFNTNIVSLKLVPGTGWMAGTWYSILASYNLGASNVPLFIKLDPEGLISGCYGGGRLIDL
jgi:hypothetical protein